MSPITPSRWAMLANAVPSLVWVTDAEGDVSFLNEGWFRYTGLTPEESLGAGWMRAVHPDDAPRVGAHWARAVAQGEIFETELRYRREDGLYRWFLARALPDSSSGQPIRWFGTSTDIDDQKKAEALHVDLERRFRLLVDASTALLASPQTGNVIQTILEMAQKVMTADAYSVWRKDDGGHSWQMYAAAGLSPQFIQGARTSREERYLVPPHPVPIADVLHDPFVGGRREALRQEGVRSLLVIPLHVSAPEPNGTVTLYWKTPHLCEKGEIETAAALGNLAASALATADLYERESHLRSEAQAKERAASILARAGEVLGSSLDYQETLAHAAQLVVPEFADWCTVDVVLGNKAPERVAVGHHDPEKFAYEYDSRYPPREDDLLQVVLRTGEAVMLQAIPDELLVKRARDPEHLRLLRRMELSSVIVTPMVAHGETLGLLTFALQRSDRRYQEADLQFAKEFARRAASSIRQARLHQNVRQSEERYRSLLSTTSAIVWTRDPSGQFIEPQYSWEAYTGQTWEEHRGFGWLQAMHPDDREHIEQEWRCSVRRQDFYETEGRLFHAASNDYRYFNVRAAPVRDQNGTVREWVGTVTDIDEKKKAEKERIRLMEREREARQTAELLNRVGPTLSVELDRQRLAQSVIDIATKLTGAHWGAMFQQETGGGHASPLYALSGPSREGAGGQPAQQPPRFSEKQTVRISDISEDPRRESFAVPGATGKVRSYMAAPMVSRSGEVLGVLLFGHESRGVFTAQHEEIVTGIAAQAAIAFDNARLFTQAQAARRSLERSNEELRRANIDLEQFAYSASHDLREPIRMVSLYSQMLQRKYGGQLDTEAEDYLRFNVEGAKRLDLLVRDLLAYTQAVGTSESRTTAEGPDRVLDEAIAALRDKIEESGATIEREKLPLLLVPEAHLRQLFHHLLENSLKYRSDAPPRIRVRAERAGSLWKLSVSDNGIGIAPQYAQEVFGIFRRLHRIGEYSGTGIGLAICQKIVHRYGGTIWVESAGEGSGTCICMTLPGEGELV